MTHSPYGRGTCPVCKRDMSGFIARVCAAAQKAKDSGNAWDLDDLVHAVLPAEGASRG